MNDKMTLLAMFFFLLSAIGTAAKGASIMGKMKSSPGVVSVDLTPQKFDDGKLIFNLRVTTHSASDLHTIDLKKIAILHVGANEYHPTEAPKLLGHHSGGKLIYILPSEPKEFKITINGLNEPTQREFVWP